MKTLKAIVIDDDPGVLNYLRFVLERSGYEVYTYDGPAEFPLYKSSGCPCSLHQTGCPDLIISDVIMHRANGLELLESFIQKGCRCRHLALISGTTITGKYLDRMDKYGIRFFLKPLDLDDFYDWLGKVAKEIAERPSA